ncbi:MAG TPA: FAD-dependent monooxygenase [Hyalangium sp.]|nr:FAD-dependent monooxygenase [Hyalangium sp.]
MHAPTGGQGLNIGVQDAVNLGWKLAQVVKGLSPETLLDTYHAERHPIGARVLRLTMAQIALGRGDDRPEAPRENMAELLKMEQPRKQYAAMMSGLDVHYELGAGDPLLGRRMPDLELSTESGPKRVFSLLHEARPVFLNLGEPGAFDITPWRSRFGGSMPSTRARRSSLCSVRSLRPRPFWFGPMAMSRRWEKARIRGYVTRSPSGSDRPRRRCRGQSPHGAHCRPGRPPFRCAAGAWACGVS